MNLINRNTFHFNKRLKLEREDKIRRNNFKSKLVGILQEVDNNARKYLFRYGYDKLFTQIMISLKVDVDNDNKCYHVYKTHFHQSKREECMFYQKISFGDRCTCHIVHVYRMQCCHEICISSIFHLKYFSIR